MTHKNNNGSPETPDRPESFEMPKVVELNLDEEQKCFIANRLVEKNNLPLILLKLNNEYPEFKTADSKAVIQAINKIKKDEIWKKYIKQAEKSGADDPVQHADVSSPIGRLKIINNVINDEVNKGQDGDKPTISTFIRLAQVESAKIAAMKSGVYTYEDFIKAITTRVEKYGVLRRKAQVG